MSCLEDEEAVTGDGFPPPDWTETPNAAGSPEAVETIDLSSDSEPSDTEDDPCATAIHATSLVGSSETPAKVENDAPHEVKPHTDVQDPTRFVIRRVIRVPVSRITPRLMTTAKPPMIFPSGAQVPTNFDDTFHPIQKVNGIYTSRNLSYGRRAAPVNVLVPATPYRKYMTRPTTVSQVIGKVGNVTVIRKVGLHNAQRGAPREIVDYSTETVPLPPMIPTTSGRILPQPPRVTVKRSSFPAFPSGNLGRYPQSATPSPRPAAPTFPVRTVIRKPSFLPPTQQQAINIEEPRFVLQQSSQAGEPKSPSPADLLPAEGNGTLDFDFSTEKVTDAPIPYVTSYARSKPKLRHVSIKLESSPLVPSQLDSEPQKPPEVTTLADCLGQILEDEPKPTKYEDVPRVTVGRLELLDEVGMEHNCILCGDTVTGGIMFEFFDPLADHLLMNHMDNCQVFECESCGYGNASEGILNWHVANRHPSKSRMGTTVLNTGERMDVLVRKFFPSASRAISGPPDFEDEVFMNLWDNIKFIWLVGSRGYKPPLHQLFLEKRNRQQDYGNLADALGYINGRSDSDGCSTVTPSPSNSL